MSFLNSRTAATTKSSVLDITATVWRTLCEEVVCAKPDKVYRSKAWLEQYSKGRRHARGSQGFCHILCMYLYIYIFIKVHIYYIHVKHVCRCWRADLVLPLLVEDGKRKDCFRDLQHHMPPSKLDPCISMSLLLQAQMADYKRCSVQLLKTEPA